MPVSYRFIKQQGPPGSSMEGKEAVVGRSVSNETISTSMMAEEIARRSTMSVPDTYGVIYAIREMLQQELLKGNIVQIEGLGSFRISASTGLLPEEKRLKAEDFNTIRINFHPDPIYKTLLRKLDFIRTRKS